jgi:streptogramin lyase
VTAGAGVIIGSFTSTPVFTDTGRPVRRIPVETPWLVSTGGHLYRVPADGSLAELDPTSLAVLRTYQVPAHRPEDGDPSLVGDGAGHLFYRPDSTHLYQVDLADGAVTSLLELPHAQATTGMAWAFGSLWVTNFGVDTIWRIKPR